MGEYEPRPYKPFDTYLSHDGHTYPVTPDEQAILQTAATRYPDYANVLEPIRTEFDFIPLGPEEAGKGKAGNFVDLVTAFTAPGTDGVDTLSEEDIHARTALLERAEVVYDRIFIDQAPRDRLRQLSLNLNSLL